MESRKSVTTTKRDLLKLLKRVEKDGDLFVITRNGKAAGILMNPQEYEGLVETLEILSDQKWVRQLKKAEEDFQKGRVYTHAGVFKG